MTVKTANIRPLFNYFGSKFILSRKLLGMIPPHHTYIEPFCGSAAMFFAKQSAKVEILNDLNHNITTLFRILRDPVKREKLCELITLTPYSREEYTIAQDYRDEKDEMVRTWKFLILSNMGFAGKQRYKTGWKTEYQEYRTISVWNRLPNRLTIAAQRLKNAQIDNRPAIDVLQRTDHKEAFHFIDPPYPYYSFETPKHCYDFSMTDEEHIELIEVLKNLTGKAMITMYQNEIYDQLLDHGYHKIEVNNKDMQKNTKIETVYMNYQYHGDLFNK